MVMMMMEMMWMMEMVLKNEGWRGKRRSGGLRGHTQAAPGGALRLRQRHSGSEVIFLPDKHNFVSDSIPKVCPEFDFCK